MKVTKRITALLTAAMIMASNIAPAFASSLQYDSPKNEIVNGQLGVIPAKLKDGEKAEDFIKNPAQPAIYSLRTDYLVQKGEKYEINYQPYIASVGEAASPKEQTKVNQKIKLPDLAGYDKADNPKTYKIDYSTIKTKAEGNGKTGDENYGYRYEANQDFRYQAIEKYIKIKNIFQDMNDFTKYTNPDGTITDSEGNVTNKDGSVTPKDKVEKDHQYITSQKGNTGSTMQVSPLDEKFRRGFVPESDRINMQVPEDATNFVVEYRYNRAQYNVVFDCKDGTPIPTRTLYYEQEIPKIDENSIPKKTGCDFLGWMPSHDLKSIDGRDFKKGEIIKKTDGKASLDLDVNLKMPALDLGTDENTREKLTFTAVWKDKEKADYAIQFWAEKADHADKASILDKYDYIGTRVHEPVTTGSKPNLDTVPVDKIKFPDLDDARLRKIWRGDRFNRGKDLFLNKFFVYNKDLTDKENADPENPSVVKSVSATGKTVYNIYYDRQVYDLYFTKSNALPAENTFYPEIWGYDEDQGEVVKKGGPGNPYHYKARFNQLMLDWPNDAMQTKGFSEGMQSFGWGPNYASPNWPTHLDTPPYRLNADEFLDMANYDKWGGYTKKIDKGDGTIIKLDWSDYKILSFGIKQDKNSMPHHMDFWMDGFKDGETIIRYDLYRYKADTNSETYAPSYPKVQGFTGKRANETPEYLDSDGIDAKNDERADVTPFPDKTYTDMYGARPLGEMKFIKAFFNNGDEFGDPDGWDGFDKNGYLKFEYTRNKYPLRFNHDPSKIKGDNEFNSKNSIDTFYEFPLKALSPEVGDEYKKDNPANLLDNPEKLQELELTDLIFTDPKDGKLKVKRPDNLSDQMVFKGWALDPAGTKLIWENPGEKMPNHPVNLYAKWGEPDYKWKVTFDPNGGSLPTIDEESLTTQRQTIQEGDIGQEEKNTYARKGYAKEPATTKDGKQIFTVIQRQKLVKPKNPTRKGYDFMGWEVIRYKKNSKGEYTDEVDDSYRTKYGVPELYTFGNDVVGPIDLKAIWNPNQKVDVKVYHHFLDKDCKNDVKTKDIVETLANKRTGYYTATVADKQGQKWILAPHDELMESEDAKIKETYVKYNKNFEFNNTYFQNQRIEPLKIKDPSSGAMIDNPKYKGNVFHFFYRPFRQREYQVNFIDERGKAEIEKFYKELKLGDVEALKNKPEYTSASDEEKKEKLQELYKNNKDKFENNRSKLDKILEKYRVVEPESVIDGNRHYDARNYRPIPGWKLVSAPQQQLFFDVNEDTNEFMGINHTGGDQIFFYYKDARVIEVKNPKDKVPDGYVRVTFKAEEGGSFGKDAQGKAIKEINYDVIKGLNSNLLPVPQELVEGNEKEKDKYYIIPEPGKNFIKWDNERLLNKNTMISDNHTFTAYFDWKEIKINPLVVTESFTDPKGKWTNDFAPSVDKLKGQVKWFKNKVEEDLPAGVEVTFASDIEKTIADSFKELGKADKDELVREVKIPAKIKYADSSEQDIEIPVKVYKNVYEALTGTEKPLFLSEAEKADLKDVTRNYVKVTVAPTGDLKSKDNKVYYVNPKAWVVIPEVDAKDNSTFTNWTSDKEAQNENGKKDGIYDFAKRHIFTEDTVISPRFSKDVEKEDKGKPDVPDSFVKVIVRTTNKAKDPSETIFWVDPSKEVAIPMTNPEGKVEKVDFKILGKKDATYVFKQWQIVKKGPNDDDLADVGPTKIDLTKHKYTDKVTVIEASYSQKIDWFKIFERTKTEELHTPKGKVITDKDLIDKIIPQEDKEIDKIEVISRPDQNTVGKSEAKVIITYKDGSTQGSKEKPIVIPVEVHENKVPANPDGSRPKTALANYVKVIFQAGEGGSVSGNLVYYVSPEVSVNMTDEADKVSKTPTVGYTSNGGTWTPEIKEEKIENEKTYIFNFKKSDDIVEKTDDPEQKIPSGYVKVTFKTDGNGKLAGDKEEITYYVNPQAGIKLVEIQAGDKQLAVPKPVANTDYTFINWVEDLDLTKPITGDREYVAKFAKGQVSLSYVIGEGAKGTAPETVTTAKGTKVRLATDKDISKKDHTFKGWLIGEKIYQAGDEITLNETTTATAVWEKDADVIPFNPEEPIAKPSGYVRVSFEADDGLTLTNVKNYYVKKNAGIKIGDKTIIKPTPKAKIGYEFEAWSPTDKEEIENEDIVVKAKSNPYKDTIEKIDENTKKPDGYVEVKFVAGENGQLEKDGNKIEEKIYYVNPNKYVKLIPPATKANTGYEFGAWDKLVTGYDIYKAPSTTITANFNEIKAVIPKTKTDESEKQEGYVEVNFVIEGDGGEIVGGQPTTYYVDPTREVTITPPTTQAQIGYVFDKWNPDTISKAKKYKDKTTVKGKFKKLDNLIPSTNDEGQPNPKPQGYVTVTFKADTNGSIKGETKYYVNPTEEVDLTAKAKEIEKIANTGYTSDGGSWKDGDKEATLKATFTENTEFVYNFKGLADVIPKTRNDEKEKPQGYIEVTFDTTDKGTIENSQETTKVVYVNPEKAVVLEGYAPQVSPKTGYTFANWDTSINKAIQYKDKDIIKATYTALENISTTVKAGFVKVVFKTDQGGSLEGTTEYWIKPNTEVKVPAPKVNTEIGYTFDKWDKDLKVTLQEKAEPYVITAKYTKEADIIPDDGTKPQPSGYVKVTFEKGANGELEGQRNYFVNPKAGKTLAEISKPQIKPNTGFKENGWDKEDDTSIDGNLTVTAQYQPIDDVVPKTGENGKENHQPSGYVKVTFKADENGKLAGDKEEITYYVNPQEGIRLVEGVAGEKKLQVPDTKPSENYKFIKWFEAIDETTPITGNREYVAIFGKTEVSLTYDLNGGSGTVPETKKVPYGTSLRLATDEGISKTDAKFIGWEIEGKIYKPGAEITLTKDQKAIAKWTDDQNIISYNPKDPITRPSGYVRVTFKADKGLRLTEEKAYYVKADKGLTLKDIKDGQGFGYPTYKEETGYSFDKWDKEESTVIKTDIELTAKATETNDVVPKTKDDDSEKPQGFVKVTFVAGENGNLGKETNTFFVNPTKYVKLSPPSTKADTGYVFAGWDKNATEFNIYDKDTTITARFNPIDSVIPKTKDNESEKPEGFVEVNFVIEPATGGKIVEKEITTYYVKPNTEVTIPQPQTKADIGYEFDKWDPDTKTTRKYTDQVTTIKGSFKDLPAYIPAKDKDEKDKPNGYIRIVFRADENGWLAEQNDFIDQKVYYVNPNATIDYVKDLTQGIEKVANPGYTADGGNWKDETGLLSKLFSKDKLFVYHFKEAKNVIPDGKGEPIPAGFVKVTLRPTDKATDSTEKSYWVNPKEEVEIPFDNPAGNTVEDKAHKGYKTTYTFKEWKVVKGSVVTYKGKPIKGQFKEETVLEATYTEKTSGKGYYLTPAVKVKKDTITPLGKTPKPEELIINTPGQGKDPLPDGTKISYEKGGEPDTSKPGSPTAKVKIEYPNGKIVVVEVPIKVVDNIVPQEGSDKPKVPANYVKVVIDTTDKATENTYFVKTYWVNPEAEVSFPIKDPTGKKNNTFTKWMIDKEEYNKEAKRKFTQAETTIKASYKDADEIIPYDPENPTNKPIGYVRVTYKAEEGLSLKEAKAYYVNPEAGKTLGQLEKPEVEAKVGYTFDKWDKDDKTVIDKDLEVTAKAKKSEDVIPEKSPDGKTNKQPAGFVKVTFVPTELANEQTRKEVSYYVNPNKNVSLTPEEPVGKEETDEKGYTTTYTFTGWKYETTSWDKSSPVKGKFADGTRILGQYTKKTRVKIEKVLPAPKPNKEVITPKEGTPKPEELIINTPGQGKDPLPDGTKISYEKGGEPDTSKPGSPTAKVKIEYPNGKIVVVEVPIKVVDNIVPQEGSDKPKVPANYVKVVIDTTDKATENTYFVKTYWVNPEAEVSFPVKVPSGKSEEIDGVTRQYEFSSWKLEGSDKDYGSHIKDKFTAKESKIVASYKTDKNIEPEGNDGRLIPEGEKPHPKDFIKNYYKDNDPDNKDNLPPGTKFTFKKGEEPNTDSPNEGSTTIVVEYPNGEKKEIEVGYKVIGKVVEQEGKEKPDVPDDYVKVSLNTTDKSLDETKTYWVQPRVEVTIPDYSPEGKDAWKFKEWDKNLTDVFIKDTEIRAIYSMKLVDLDQEPEPKGGMITTMKGEQPSEEAYRKQIVLEEEGKEPYHLTDDDKIEYKEPNVDEVKDHDVEVTITLKDGTELKTVVVVRVLDKIYELDKDDPEKNKNIPDNYIQVIVVPTSDNKDAEERYYAVAPSASKEDLRKIGLVDIDPVEGTTFVKWQVRKGEGPYQDLNKDGEAYTDPINIIKAKFVNDIVVQTGDKKPDVPEGYVKVTVDRGEHPRHPRKTIYWVNPDKEVDLREVDPLASDGYTFDKWTMKQEDKLVNEDFDLEGKSYKYEKETYIVASYKEEKCPAPPKNPSDPGIIEVESKEKVDDKVDDKDEENGGTKGTTSQLSSNNTSNGRVKTGIVSNLGMYISIIGLSAGAIFASNKKKK